MRKLGPVLCALLVLGAMGCGRGDAPPSAGAPERGALRVAAVGDSITDANSPDFAAGDLGSGSWVTYALGGGLTFAGGWARWGATTDEMARNVNPVEADVLVIMAGTNDVALGRAFGEIAENLTEIARVVGAEEVVLAGIPPIDHFPRGPNEFNGDLERFARERGWHWVDAGSAVRTSAGTFEAGMASDGVHPTTRGAQELGETIGAALQRLAEPPR